MASLVGGRPNPDRQRLLVGTRYPSPLEEVAEAVSVFTEYPGDAYVERFGADWRWSPAHRGGSYPLLRITARFLQVDHYRVIVPFRTVHGDWAVLMPEEDESERPNGSVILTFSGPTNPVVIAACIVQELGG
jgi:hypothetical protein